MTKLKNPLLGLGATGGLGDAISFKRSRRQNIAEKKPIPFDAKSSVQLQWRHMFQKVVALWHALSALEKQEWESLARSRHMTGYAWFVSQALRPNPGIYLPLQGGTMQGNIDIAKYRLLKLPLPTDDQEAASKKYVDDAAAAPDYPMKLMPAITRYVMPGWYSKSPSSAYQTAGRIFYIPIFVSEKTTYTRIVVYVETLMAGTADLRIFAWANGLPGALILSAGTVNTGSTGCKEIAINQELTRGYYFLATRCSGDPRFNGLNADFAIAPPIPGFHYNCWPQSPELVLYVNAAYADPAPAPTHAVAPLYATVFLKET